MNKGVSFANDLEAWARSRSIAVERPKDSIRVRAAGKELFYGRETERWLFGVFRELADGDELELKRAFSADWQGWLPSRRYWRGRVATTEELGAVKSWLERHSR